MSDRERYVPTPEELEEGKLKRSVRSHRSEPDHPDGTGRIRSLLRRRAGVGRRRKYEEAESNPVQPQTRGTEPSPTAEEETAESAKPETQGTRVRSVRIRRRETTEVVPAYAPYSPQAVFHSKATAKGHRMGKLVRVPNSPNWTASCENCGMDGELVVQHYENWSEKHSYEHPRGYVIERTCPAGGS